MSINSSSPRDVMPMSPLGWAGNGDHSYPLSFTRRREPVRQVALWLFKLSDFKGFKRQNTERFQQLKDTPSHFQCSVV